MSKINIQLYTPHPGQSKLHNSKARFRVMPAGRRVGKTTACCNELIKATCETNDITGAWVAPTYRQSKIAYRLIKKALHKVLSHTSDTELRLELPNGSVMIFCSSDNYNALRGLAIHFLVVDECADVAQEAWFEVLRPCLADTQGRAIFIGTPKGHNWFYQLYLRGIDPLETEYESFVMPTSASPYVPQKEIDAAQRELPEETFRQEFLAVFIKNNAGVFRGIDGCIRGTLLDTPVEGRTYVGGWDAAKFHDFSVYVVMDCATQEVVHFFRTNHTDYSVQIREIVEIASLFRCQGGYMDVTGVGAPLLEQVNTALRKKNLASFEPYLFTNQSKKELIELLQLDIQHGSISFPDIPVMIGELRTMQYALTASRNITYNAPDGAYDDCVIGLALANKAAKAPRGPVMWSVEADDVMIDNPNQGPDAPDSYFIEMEHYIDIGGEGDY